jgi:hypothetical protein
MCNIVKWLLLISPIVSYMNCRYTSDFPWCRNLIHYARKTCRVHTTSDWLVANLQCHAVYGLQTIPQKVISATHDPSLLLLLLLRPLT